MKKTILKILILTLFLMAGIREAMAQEELTVVGNWQKYADASNSFYKTLSEKAYAQLAGRDSLVSDIKSLQGWKLRQKEIFKKLRQTIGPFPERTPLNPQITGKIDEGEYRVENIVFESQPHFYVTSSLFIPKGIQLPAPVVIYVSGHTEEGYRSSTYQHVILNLVKKGFIVFAFDPIGQGERKQYYEEGTGKSMVGGPTHEHSYPGAQVFMNGSSLAKYEIWDGIRAVDYLCSRPEIDTARIGITGRSGGGTQSAYMAAFDSRIYAAAPENYITNFTRLIASIGPQDAEQNFFHGIALGLDHPDLLEVRAPKPCLMITTTRDMFSIQGAMETAAEVKRIYKAYGEPDSFYRVEDDTTHASTKKNREAMYRFFRNAFHYPGSTRDEEVKILDKELQVTPTGQVITSYKDAKIVFDLNKAEAGPKFKKLENRRMELFPKSVYSLSQPTNIAKEGNLVFTGRFQKKGFSIEKYFIEGKDYPLPFILLKPDHPTSNFILLLHPKGKKAEMKESEPQKLLEKGYTVVIPDLVGTGELGNGLYKGDSYINQVSYGLWYLSILTNQEILDRRSSDLSLLANTLKNHFEMSSLDGLAYQDLSSVLLLSAIQEDVFDKVILKDPLFSFSSMITQEKYNPDFLLNIPAGFAGKYDFADLVSAYAPGKIAIIHPIDAENKEVNLKESSDIQYLERIYKSINRSGHLKIYQKEGDILNWLDF